ncbi:MAG: rhodanese-related sulfurtransferase [Tunicatimonas sp.]|uniref:oxygen-dependent tRNA uridine(34) hydroxylase TrhO n=1 Tax=Tunicatimonas sp. TaxID=1940096 RepID=UPI003C7067EF
MHLHNRVDREILKQQIRESNEERITLSFYQYAHIGKPTLFRDHLYLQWAELGVLGRVYVANEGINAQINVPKDRFEQFQEQLATITFLKNVRLNIAVDDNSKSFYKLKIQVKKKIVADGLNDATFDVTNKGIHLKADDFNVLTDDPDTVVVDMRNHYESEVGHFENAILPDVDSFRESLPKVEDILKEHREKNIVMYCTGGIRCEKASAYFKHKGFENVYQLEGGIINYARQVQEKGLPNKFKGKNFVFDERLGERISSEIISHCHQCGAPCDTHTNCRNEACHLLFIQCEGCAKKYNGCCTTDCQEFIELPEEEQKALRKLKQQKRNIFHKGRSEHLKHQLRQ